MNKKEFLKQLRLFVEEGSIEEALDWLNKNTDCTSLFSNDILMLKSQFSRAKSQFLLRGIIENEEYSRIVARISCAILELADKVQKKIDNPNQPRYGHGQVLHRIPSKMKILQETKCIIRIAYDIETLIKKIIVDNETKFESIQITEIMSVELIDSNQEEIFKIRTCTDEEQFIIHDDFTQWIFFVQPLKQGCYPLLLKISVIEKINDIERKRNIVFEKEINIESKEISKEETQFQIAYIQFENIQLINLKLLDIANKASNIGNIQLLFDQKTGELIVKEVNDLDSDRIVISEIASDGFACFLKGTKIMINFDEHKSIECIEVGDEILTKNRVTDKFSIEKVENVLISMSNEYIVINGLLKVTPTELIITKRGAIAAIDLRLSDYVDFFGSGFVQVMSVKTVKKNVKVYNLKFEEPCLFFADRILVGDLSSKNNK